MVMIIKPRKLPSFFSSHISDSSNFGQTLLYQYSLSKPILISKKRERLCYVQYRESFFLMLGCITLKLSSLYEIFILLHRIKVFISSLYAPFERDELSVSPLSFVLLSLLNMGKVFYFSSNTTDVQVVDELL